ncbi:MAG: alpha/beta hydrolase [Bacteroidia bacterium]|jgi:acetyl esterase/lipase
MKAFKTVVIPALCIHLLSCKKADQWQESALNTSYKQTLYSISYGDAKRNQMDIALPKNRTTNTPVVILIHGGAWVLGDKSYFAREIQQFADAGVACATINYSFASNPKNIHHNEIVADIRRAVDFIASKSTDWQVSPNKFGLAGHSAGGHLALITSYTKNQDAKIKACVSWAGPLDFIDAEQLQIDRAKEVFKIYVGRTLNTSNDTALYKAASPYWTADNNSVPTLLIHGTLDTGVPYTNAVKMQQHLESLGVYDSLLLMEGAYHIWTGQHLRHAQNATLDWFSTKL